MGCDVWRGILDSCATYDHYIYHHIDDNDINNHNIHHNYHNHHTPTNHNDMAFNDNDFHNATPDDHDDHDDHYYPPTDYIYLDDDNDFPPDHNYWATDYKYPPSDYYDDHNVATDNHHYTPTFAINHYEHDDHNYNDHDDNSCAHDDYFVYLDYIYHDDGCSHYFTAFQRCPHDSCKTPAPTTPTKQRTRRRKRSFRRRSRYFRR